MKFDTGMGTLNVPRDCVLCIAADRYTRCTACSFKEILIAHAKPILDKMNEELSKAIR